MIRFCNSTVTHFSVAVLLITLIGCNANKLVVRDPDGGLVEVQKDAYGATSVRVMPGELAMRGTMSKVDVAVDQSGERENAARELEELRSKRDSVRTEINEAVREREIAIDARNQAKSHAADGVRFADALQKEAERLCGDQTVAEEELIAAYIARDEAVDTLARVGIQVHERETKLAELSEDLNARLVTLDSVEADLAAARSWLKEADAERAALQQQAIDGQKEPGQLSQRLESTNAEEIERLVTAPAWTPPILVPEISASDTDSQPTADSLVTTGQSEVAPMEELPNEAWNVPEPATSANRMGAPVILVLVFGGLLLLAAPLYLLLHRTSPNAVRLTMEVVEGATEPKPVEFALEAGDTVPVDDTHPDGALLSRRGRSVTLIAPRTDGIERVVLNEDEEVSPRGVEKLRAGTVFHIVRPDSVRRSYYVRDVTQTGNGELD